MAYTLGNATPQTEAAGAASVTLAFGGGVTVGSLLVLTGAMQDFSSLSSTVTDSQGNTWSLDKSQAVSSFYLCGVWTAIAKASGANTITWTPTSGNSTFSGIGQEFKGPAATPLDQSSVNTGNSTSATPGSITPSQDKELVVVCYSPDGTSETYTPPGGYTQMLSEGAVNAFGWSGYKIQTTAGAENPALGLNNAASWGGAIASYKSAATGGLFEPTPMTGLGAGGPFFGNPIG